MGKFESQESTLSIFTNEDIAVRTAGRGPCAARHILFNLEWKNGMFLRRVLGQNLQEAVDDALERMHQAFREGCVGDTVVVGLLCSPRLFGSARRPNIQSIEAAVTPLLPKGVRLATERGVTYKIGLEKVACWPWQTPDLVHAWIETPMPTAC